MTTNLPEKQTATFPSMLEKFKSEIARALPRHLDGDRMCRIALTEFRKNPKLAECDPKSIFAAVIVSAQLGLECGLLGEASLVPFKTECQLIPGYLGLMKLAMNTGKITDIYAHSVRENDEFEIVFGLDRTLKHRPLMNKSFPASDEKRGPIAGYYAVAVFADGKKTFQAMSSEDVLKIRDASLGYKAAKKWNKTSTWDTHPEAMGIKTVIRRLCKYLPKSPELAQALALDTVADQTGAQKVTVDEAISGTWAPDYQDVAEAIDVAGPADVQDVKTISEKFHEAFDADARNMSVPLAVFERFVAELAGKRNTTADDMMQAAVDDPGRFMEAVKKYLAKSKPIEAAPVETPPATDAWADFRSQFINLKGAGFSTFVYKHLEQLKSCPMNIQMEAVAKWDKLYPNTLFPLNAPASAAPPQQPETLDQPVTESNPPQPQEAPAEVHVSYSQQYKNLRQFKEEFPEEYSQARAKLGFAPDSIENCTRLHEEMKRLVEAKIPATEPVPEDSEPMVEDENTSGF